MAVTMQEVAEAAGVCLSTVSRALAGSQRVKPATRRRIEKLARDMGYIPSAIARGLATKRTYNMGVVVLNITDPLIGELVRAIDKAALERGYGLLLSHCGDDPQREMGAINILRQQRVDSMIVADPSVSKAYLPLLEESGLPLVLINHPDYPYSVSTDNFNSARLAVCHLLELGHKSIAYIDTGKTPEESADRRNGYLSALKDYQLSPREGYIRIGNGWPEGGRRCMRELLRLPDPPSAVFCFNDLMAIGAIGEAQAAGFRVPEDLSVIGFDDIAINPYIYPPLTSIAQQTDQLAQAAVEIALCLVEKCDTITRRLLPGILVQRGSTAHFKEPSL